MSAPLSEQPGLFGPFRRAANLPALALLFLAYIACEQGFAWRQAKLGHDNPALDARFGYTPGEAQKLFRDLGKEGRGLYATTQVTLDLVFPAVYATLFGAFIVGLYAPSWSRAARALQYVPVLGAACDWTENGLIAYLAWTFDGQASSLAGVASGFTVAKWILDLTSLGLVLVGGLAGVFGYCRDDAPGPPPQGGSA